MFTTATTVQSCPRTLLRVLVADGVGAVNESLTALLSDSEAISIFGCAQEPAKVLALVQTVHPEVVILDLHLPGPVGLKTLKQLKLLQPAPIVIVLSHYEMPALREACLASGADCFLEKTGAFERLREVLAGLASESAARDQSLAGQLPSGEPRAKHHGQRLQCRIPTF